MKKHVLRAIHGAQWASREAKLEAEKKIEHLYGSFVGTDMFFNYTFLQERYGRVSMSLGTHLASSKTIRPATSGKCPEMGCWKRAESLWHF